MNETTYTIKVGDRVRFRKESRAWKLYGVEPDAKGDVVEIYHEAEPHGRRMADVIFPGLQEPERGVPFEELEIVKVSARRPAWKRTARD
jgi:hypothetical protein